MKWKIRNSKIIRFWTDRWLGHEPLCETYPRLYANSINKQATLGEMGNWQNNTGEWNLEWRRQWFKWEVNQLTILKQQLGTKTLKRENDDCWVWVDEDS